MPVLEEPRSGAAGPLSSALVVEYRSPVPILLVCGSEKLQDPAVFRAGVALLATRPGLVVHGGGTGVDWLADNWARSQGIRTRVFAKHLVEGVNAGALRDQRMLDYCANANSLPDGGATVLAFPDGPVCRSWGCIQRAGERRLLVVVYPVTASLYDEMERNQNR